MNDPKLLYCSKNDGYSLGNLYNKTKPYQNYPMLILIKTDTNIFGAYCNEMLHFSKVFYGNNETFVFMLTPEAQKYGIEESVYENKDHVLSQDNLLQFGGGEIMSDVMEAEGIEIQQDKPAFKLNGEFSEGQTNQSKIYQNKLLNGSKDKNYFMIEILELYALI